MGLEAARVSSTVPKFQDTQGIPFAWVPWLME
jgi:hypothetical protein